MLDQTFIKIGLSKISKPHREGNRERREFLTIFQYSLFDIKTLGLKIHNHY